MIVDKTHPQARNALFWFNDVLLSQCQVLAASPDEGWITVCLLDRAKTQRHGKVVYQVERGAAVTKRLEGKVEVTFGNVD